VADRRIRADGTEGRSWLRRELDAIADPAARDAKFQEMVAASYAHGKATNIASYFEIDDVIDPAESRRWIATLRAMRRPGAGGATSIRGERDQSAKATNPMSELFFSATE
jgi:hypothetical protein